MTLRCCILVLLLAALFLALPADATVIVLKNGNRLEGTVVEEDADSVTVKTIVGMIELKRDDIDTIIEQDTPLETYRKDAANLAPDDVDGRMKLAAYCERNGLQIQAADLYRQVLKLKPDHPDALRQLLAVLEKPAKKLSQSAHDLLKEKQYADARDKFLQLTQFYSETSYARDAEHRIAETFFAQGRLPDAMKQWETALKADRFRVECYLGILQVCQKMREWDKAAKIIDGVLAFAKDEKLKGQLSAKRAILEQLAQQQKRANEDANNPEPHLAIGRLLARLGEDDMSRAETEKAVAMGAKDAQAFKGLAEFYEQQLNVTKAIRYWTLAREADLNGPIGRLADERLPRLETLALIPRYLTSPDPDTRDKIVERLKASKIPFAVMETVARQGRTYDDQPTGISDGTFKLPRENLEAAYSTFLPASYTPDRSYPAILALHGAGSSGANYVYLWAEQADKEGYILVAPTAPPEGWNELGQKIALKALQEARQKFNIDPDRICVEGTSIGAECAWLLAMHYPHLFAAVASRAGRVDLLNHFYLPNLMHVPVYIVHGSLDFTYPVADMRGVRKKLRELHYRHLYHEHPRGGHSPFIDENQAIIEWLADKRRPPYPPKVTCWTRLLAHDRSYWIKAEAFDGKIFDPSDTIAIPTIGETPLTPEQTRNYFFSMAKEGLVLMDASAEGNTIHVRTKHVKGYTLLLDDKLVDMDKPIEVRTNGIVSFKGKLERDVAFMLEWLRRYHDASELFSAYLRIIPGNPHEK